VLLPPSDELVLDKYLGTGLQPGEEQLPEDGPVSSSEPQFNEAAMGQLEAMGFPTIRCQKALLATGNSDPEAAMNWLFEHMEDPDIDTPLQTGGGKKPEPSEDSIQMVASMGFTSAKARRALRETDGNIERAVDWLFNHPDEPDDDVPASTFAAAPPASNPGGSSALPARYRLKAFISHKGPSVHSGHYVAHIRVQDQWILFNDEKVVKADNESIKELKPLAYLYVFERV